MKVSTHSQRDSSGSVVAIVSIGAVGLIAAWAGVWLDRRAAGDAPPRMSRLLARAPFALPESESAHAVALARRRRLGSIFRVGLELGFLAVRLRALYTRRTATSGATDPSTPIDAPAASYSTTRIGAPIAAPGAPSALLSRTLDTPRSVSDVPRHPVQPTRVEHHPMRDERITFKMLGTVALAAARRWSSQRAASKSAALALYTLFSLAPILVLVIAVAGAFFGRTEVSGQLIDEMRLLMGDQGAAAIQTVLASAQNANQGLVAGIISSVLVVIGATSAFAELKDSLDELWGVAPNESSGLWGLVRERFLSLGILLVLALLLLASLVVDSGLHALQLIWGAYWAASALAVAANVFATAFSFVVVAALFASIYKLLPSTPVAWRDVILGAIVTAALFAIGKSLIGIYLGHGFITSAYGAAGSVVALIAWVYYSALIFFYGALLTHEYAMGIGSRKMGRASSTKVASSNAAGA